MNVLGWTFSRQFPTGIQFRSVGDLVMFGVPDDAAPDARARLRWQVQCLDAGIDFLPTTPAQVVTLVDAMRIPIAALETAISTITGHVQLSLVLDCPGVDPAPCLPVDGRGWLQARQAAHARGQAQKTIFDEFAAALGRARSPIRLLPSGLVCDVLVPRDAVETVQTQLQDLAVQFLPTQTRLTATGPWPPSGFVAIPKAYAA